MSDFPAPPDFYQQYTDEAVANDTAPPPPPVPGDHFILYGQPMNLGDPLLSSLSEHGLPEMFNTENASQSMGMSLRSTLNYCFLQGKVTIAFHVVVDSGR
eukprot:m.113218 g.113218  ORF g.113218 m.113218 type:complete len:100 (+) comp15354_c0_seq1:343-642(+)